jgi:hypothetical protein
MYITSALYLFNSDHLSDLDKLNLGANEMRSSLAAMARHYVDVSNLVGKRMKSSFNLPIDTNNPDLAALAKPMLEIMETITSVSNGEGDTDDPELKEIVYAYTRLGLAAATYLHAKSVLVRCGASQNPETFEKQIFNE